MDMARIWVLRPRKALCARTRGQCGGSARPATRYMGPLHEQTGGATSQPLDRGQYRGPSPTACIWRGFMVASFCCSWAKRCVESRNLACIPARWRYRIHPAVCDSTRLVDCRITVRLIRQPGLFVPNLTLTQIGIHNPNCGPRIEPGRSRRKRSSDRRAGQPAPHHAGPPADASRIPSSKCSGP